MWSEAFLVFCSFQISHSTLLISPRDHRTDLDPVGISQHFIFRNEFVAPDHQMRFDDQIQFAQQLLGAFGALDFDLVRGMAELDDHPAMIRLTQAGLQTAWRWICRMNGQITASRRAFAASSGETGLM